MAVDQDAAVIGIEEARQQADQRRFAAAVLADQGDGFAELDAQMDVGQDRIARLVGWRGS